MLYIFLPTQLRTHALKTAPSAQAAPPRVAGARSRIRQTRATRLGRGRRLPNSGARKKRFPFPLRNLPLRFPLRNLRGGFVARACPSRASRIASSCPHTTAMPGSPCTLCSAAGQRASRAKAGGRCCFFQVFAPALCRTYDHNSSASPLVARTRVCSWARPGRSGRTSPGPGPSAPRPRRPRPAAVPPGTTGRSRARGPRV
mmetsp:Transcript_4180/g.13953  ORF Transcript_4180/g.13953 Transcript_4180/m.13953 type:complete len:201 (+) Transcript_4180:37-639(+)